MKWINATGIIVNSITAVCAVWLSYIASQEQISRWRGIKTIDGSIAFSKDDPIHKKAGFMIFIQNNGATPKDIAFIKTDKNEIIHWFFVGQSAFTLSAGKTIYVFLDIKPHLKKLEQADSLILVNSIGDKKKIISKKDILKVLELYKSS